MGASLSEFEKTHNIGPVRQLEASLAQILFGEHKTVGENETRTFEAADFMFMAFKSNNVESTPLSDAIFFHGTFVDGKVGSLSMGRLDGNQIVSLFGRLVSEHQDTEGTCVERTRTHSAG